MSGSLFVGHIIVRGKTNVISKHRNKANRYGMNTADIHLLRKRCRYQNSMYIFALWKR